MDAFSRDKFLLRRNVFTFIGAKFKIFDENKNLLLFCHQKGFKLKEDIRVYSDESKSVELLSIKARKVIDFSSAYDVFDSRTNEHVGVLKRKGMKSIIRDEWLIMDRNDNEIGKIKEDSMGLALVRRFLINLIPQKFKILLKQPGTDQYEEVGFIKQLFNPFVFKAWLDLTKDVNKKIDRRLAIAAGILMLAIEGRQN